MVLSQAALFEPLLAFLWAVLLALVKYWGGYFQA